MERTKIVQCSIKIELINDSWTELRGEIAGPPDTPYEGVNLYWKLKYQKPILSIHQRAAAMTLRTVLLSLQALLAAAEPDDPQDAVVAFQYKDKYQLFETTARHWTNVYAGGPHRFPDCDVKIQRLKDMGIDEHDARAVLSKENWDLEKATESLFS
ncbi:Ubiquitin-conjugating enzyme E2-22 kDa [Eumeta japonica]|uniref:Ubiquitin-conjugating enzyme E2-22 kDa n=1 Tax=Eumeta variegata TaxID=151549 RepID=A0A4C1T2N4_EUMVA|nr:Ubiquitin-conjugating enzyme E2-22 kDa [Eumeta japonica]